jgi:hypothetical protein
LSKSKLQVQNFERIGLKLAPKEYGNTFLIVKIRVGGYFRKEELDNIGP